MIYDADTEAVESLAESGLSAGGLLRSTGVAEHARRLEQGQVTAAALTAYAEDIRRLTAECAIEGAPLPVDFWDVRTPAMEAAGLTEYALAQRLAAPPYRQYVRLLARCFQLFTAFREGRGATATATALSFLPECTAYVRCGAPVDMTAARHNRPEQQAIFLWQQVTTGTNRQIPYLHRDVYTHSYWGRFNVVEMTSYASGVESGVDPLWGLTGFAPRFIRDPTNTNQIEHMCISALAQITLGIPAGVLNLVEELEWLLRKSSYAASWADKALNRAIAQHFVPVFRLEEPQAACESLRRVLAEET